MGLMENLSGLIGGRGKSVTPVALEAGEKEVARAVACTLKGGGRAWVGGDLVVTNRRVLFAPLDVKDVAALLSYGLKKAGAPGGATGVVGWIGGQVEPSSTDVSDIVSATRGRSAGLLNPPTVTVHLRDGTNLEFGILSGRMSPNVAKSNEQRRDEVLHLLQTISSTS